MLATWKEEKVEIKALKSKGRDPENLKKVEISGQFRKVTASTVNGQVYLAQASGDIMLSTTNGDIKAKDI
jgi:DUF4097 and DUF4098 domain-containing protein YvlB